MDAKIFQQQVIKAAKNKKILPEMIPLDKTPIPAIHKVEWDLTFHCNDYCKHCVTNSGPECKEFTKTSDCEKIIENIKKYNLINRFRIIFKNKKIDFDFKSNSVLKKLENLKKPPAKLTEKISASYLECLHGNNYKTILKIGNEYKKLSFGRPHIRLSGGEFYTWPREKNGKTLDEKERLKEQSFFLKKLRKNLPEYDIWILTNGRFASNKDQTCKVLSFWNKHIDLENNDTGKTRICISTDPFHSPPSNSSIRDMLDNMWYACKKNHFSSPFLYGIPKKEIYFAGRAFETMDIGKYSDFKNASKSNFNPTKNYKVTTNSLIKSDGCNELKGFFVKVGENLVIPSNNININPSGHLSYCCAQVGDFGDFVNNPVDTLKNVVRNPVAVMMRRGDTVSLFLNLVASMDPSIKVFGEGKEAAVVGSTCYQMLSGKRKK